MSPRTASGKRTMIWKRRSGHLLDLDVGGAFDCSQDRGYLLCRAQHRPEFLAEDLDRQILSHPGDQLVETHLDRLREADLVAGQLGRFDVDPADQFSRVKSQ